MARRIWIGVWREREREGERGVGCVSVCFVNLVAFEGTSERGGEAW